MADDIVSEIKLRIDLVELISTYVPLKSSGRTHKGLCPFHSEKTPSFHVDRERGFYRCYGCGKSGDCFSFIQEKEGFGFGEAGELLARRLGLEWIRRGENAEQRSERERLLDLVALAERFFRQQLEHSTEAKRYLEQRGVSPEAVDDFRLGFAPPGYEALLAWLRRQNVAPEIAEKVDLVLKGEQGWRDRFVDRIIFPIHDLEGRPIAFGGRTLRADGIPKYLNSRETPLFQKGRTLYGLNLAKRSIPAAGHAIAVEGYMDLIALHQVGIRNAVASLGTAITESHVGILRRYSDRLVVCYDGDGAGIRAAIRNSAMFEQAGCTVQVATLPEGADPDTYIRDHGADSFRALLNRADPLLDYQLNALRTGYNLADESARLPFVRDAARIIAQTSSHLTRQEYTGRVTKTLDRLAEEWYPGDPHRAMQARTALGNELHRLLHTERLNGRRDSAVTLPARSPAVPPSGRRQAEQYVLRAALSEYRWADQVVAAIQVEQFSESRLVELARKLLEFRGAAGSELAQCVDELRSDPASAELLSELLIDEAPLTDEGLEQCLQLLERAWREERLQSLRHLHEAGDLIPGDPRQEEYLRLRVELGGRKRRED